MELIGKISKGSKMDQIYIPKNRTGFSSGQYVLISSIENKPETKPKNFKPYFYGIKSLEPIKMRIIEEIFVLVEKYNPKNIIITGSFLESGFKFNDIDILIINESKTGFEQLKKQIEEAIGIKPHILSMDNKTLDSGLASDPIYNLMLSRCISKNRLIFNIKREINYKLLDLSLLKSKDLINNFDILNGGEKYYLTLNMISIALFIENKKLTRELINNEIKKTLNVSQEEIKENLIDKQEFLKKYKEVYNKTFNLIMSHIKKED